MLQPAAFPFRPQSNRSVTAAVPAAQSRERDTLTTAVEQHFNQLTVFDPRVPHGVAVVEGVREPTEARIVLHGWFTSSGPFFKGARALGWKA